MNQHGENHSRNNVQSEQRRVPPIKRPAQVNVGEKRTGHQGVDEQTRRHEVINVHRPQAMDQNQTRRLGSLISEMNDPLGSNRNISGKPMHNRAHAKRSTKAPASVKQRFTEAMTRRMSTMKQKQSTESTTSPWLEDQRNGCRLYKLEAYTTVELIDRQYAIARSQRMLRKLLITLISFLMIIIVIGKLNPLKNFSEIEKILGPTMVQEFMKVRGIKK